MLYLLVAKAEPQFLEEWNGRKGMFAKIFLINDQRNSRGWRVTWASIKKYVGTFIGQPGIEYTKCEGSVCDLDHTDGATYEQAEAAQEPFRVSTIVDYQLDEEKRMAYAIHEYKDPEVYERVKTGKLQYVSPSVWPSHGGYEKLGGQTEHGEDILDVFHWRGLHSAYVNSPAFGQVARVKATCEGEGCQLHLLTAVEHQKTGRPASAMSAVLMRHNDALHFVSVSASEEEQIAAIDKPSEDTILPILRASSSFHSCACSRTQMADKTAEEQVKELQATLKARDKEIVELKAAAKKAMEEEEEDEKEKKDAMEEEDHKPKAKSAKNTDSNVADTKALVAKIEKLEAEASAPLVAKMVEMREAAGASDEDIEAFKASLKGKGFEAIKAQHDAEAIYHSALQAKAEESEHFEFNGGKDAGALQGKSLEEIAGEVNA